MLSLYAPNLIESVINPFLLPLICAETWGKTLKAFLGGYQNRNLLSMVR